MTCSSAAAPAVPEKHVAHYNRRGGFLRPTERVDQDAVLRFADEDLQIAR